MTGLGVGPEWVWSGSAACGRALQNVIGKSNAVPRRRSHTSHHRHGGQGSVPLTNYNLPFESPILGPARCHKNRH
jgi:hypothetical protein